MEPVTIIRSRTVVIPTTNIDTDQIIPARFLTTTSREGLGARLFADWRYDAAGNPKTDFALNHPQTRGCEVLVAGRNFGCGSSREHAPWALIDYGFRAVISTGIADIFRANALKNGLLPVLVDERIGAWLMANPGAEVTIDLERMVLELPDGGVAHFPIDAFSRYCLLNGLDELEYLLGHKAAVEAHEQRLQAQLT